MTENKSRPDELIIYTDGSSRGNPGRGGYGAILNWNGKMKELSGGFKKTTNNRMELMAVIAALEALTRDGINIVVFSVSQSVVTAGKEGWLNKWIRTNFAGGKKNSDLWRRFFELSKKNNIRFEWVRGQADNP
jgi:ribonuclease HI